MICPAISDTDVLSDDAFWAVKVRVRPVTTPKLPALAASTLLIAPSDTLSTTSLTCPAIIPPLSIVKLPVSSVIAMLPSVDKMPSTAITRSSASVIVTSPSPNAWAEMFAACVFRSIAPLAVVMAAKLPDFIRPAVRSTKPSCWMSIVTSFAASRVALAADVRLPPKGSVIMTLFATTLSPVARLGAAAAPIWRSSSSVTLSVPATFATRVATLVERAALPTVVVTSRAVASIRWSASERSMALATSVTSFATTSPRPAMLPPLERLSELPAAKMPPAPKSAETLKPSASVIMRSPAAALAARWSTLMFIAIEPPAVAVRFSAITCAMLPSRSIDPATSRMTELPVALRTPRPVRLPADTVMFALPLTDRFSDPKVRPLLSVRPRLPLTAPTSSAMSVLRNALLEVRFSWFAVSSEAVPKSTSPAALITTSACPAFAEMAVLPESVPATVRAMLPSIVLTPAATISRSSPLVRVRSPVTEAVN